MKLDARRVAAFLAAPGPARVALLHGDDEGLVRHRADALTLAVAGQRDDPFRVAWLSREDHARLLEEATAIAMLGGRRVVRVRDAGDALTPLVKRVAEGAGDSLVVLECAALPARSKLRALVEAMSNGASIACYPQEGKVLQDAVAQGLAAAGVKMDPDAMAWLLDHVGSDHGATQGEVAKLALYAGAGQRLDLDDVRACVGDVAGVSFDDALDAMLAGDVALADKAIERTLAEGLAPVAITRGVLSYLGKLLAAQGHRSAGLSASDAIRALRPPVFFKRVRPMEQALATWTTRRLLTAMAEVSRVEMACKQTGAPDTLLVRRLLLTLSRQAEAARRSTGSRVSA